MSTIAENNDPTNPSYNFIVNCNPTGDVLKTCGKDSYVAVWTLSTAQNLFTDMRAAAMPLPMLQSPPTTTILKVSGYAPCSGSQVPILRTICRTPMIRMLWISGVLGQIILSLWPQVRPPILNLVTAYNSSVRIITRPLLTENIGHTILHEMTHLDAVAKLFPLDPK